MFSLPHDQQVDELEEVRPEEIAGLCGHHRGATVLLGRRGRSGRGRVDVRGEGGVRHASVHRFQWRAGDNALRGSSDRRNINSIRWCSGGGCLR